MTVKHKDETEQEIGEKKCLSSFMGLFEKTEMESSSSESDSNL